MMSVNSPQFEFYFSGDQYFNSILNHIQASKQRVRVESYIFEADEIGKKVIQHLIQANRRGVQIQIIVDGIGSLGSIDTLRSWIKDTTIQLRVYHPIPHWTKILIFGTGLHAKLTRPFFKRLNKRNHRKVFIFDDKKVILGSFNISQVHSESLTPRAWRDSALLIKNWNLSGPERAFDALWALLTDLSEKNWFEIFEDRKKSLDDLGFSQHGFRFNSKLFWRYRWLRDLNHRLRHAQRRILITNAYFLPRASVIRSLTHAAKKGVHVALCLPRLTDVPIVRWASFSIFERLQKAGVQIYEYQPQPLHAKTMVIDDWSSIGSQNLNHRSLTHDLEVEFAGNFPELTNPLVAQWDKDLRESRLVPINFWQNRTLIERVISHFFYYFRYWL